MEFVKRAASLPTPSSSVGKENAGGGRAGGRWVGGFGHQFRCQMNESVVPRSGERVVQFTDRSIDVLCRGPLYRFGERSARERRGGGCTKISRFIPSSSSSSSFTPATANCPREGRTDGRTSNRCRRSGTRTDADGCYLSKRRQILVFLLAAELTIVTIPSHSRHPVGERSYESSLMPYFHAEQVEFESSLCVWVKE